MCAKLWTKWTKFAHFKQNLHILKLQNCFIVPFPSRVETAADVIGPLYSLYHANTQNLMYTVGGEQCFIVNASLSRKLFKDDKLTLEEFREGSKQDPRIVQALSLEPAPM